MLNKETKDKLVALGFDPAKLEAAIKSDKEESLEVPTLKTEEEFGKLYTEEQKVTFGQNRFNEGKSAMEEIKAKELKTKFGIDLEGKDLEKVIEAITEKKVKEVSKPDDEKNTTIQALQKKVTDLEKSLADKDSEFSQKEFTFTQKNALKSKVPAGLSVTPDQAVTLYLAEHGLSQKDGRPVVVKDGKPIKDNLENPVEPSAHFATWLDSQKQFKKGTGKEDDDDTGGANGGKFKSISEFDEWAEKNGKNPMSEEMQKHLADNKDESFKYE